MKKKILGVLLAVGIVAGVIAGCGNSNTTQDGAENASQASAMAKARTLDEIKKSGKIKIGVFSDKNPFGYVDENGKVQGYDVYFAKRIAKDLLGSEDAVDFVYVEAATKQTLFMVKVKKRIFSMLSQIPLVLVDTMLFWPLNVGRGNL